MIARYLVVATFDEDRRSRLRRAAQQCGCACLVDRPGQIAIVTPGSPHCVLGDAGALIGQIFTPREEGALIELRADTVEAVIASRGAHLCDLHWGGYVTIVTAPDGDLVVMRAPLGELPCLFTRHAGEMCVASDVAMLRVFGLYTPRLDVDGLARHLIASDIRRNDTCLAGLGEVRGGQRLVARRDGTTVLETVWSPWRFAGTDMQIEDRDECDRRLRNAVRYVVRARGRALAPALLLLSGGLDSSIVAACLAESGTAFSALTIWTGNATGDERDYARLAAARAQCRLDERRSALRNIHIQQSAAARLPRPARRCFEQDTTAHAGDVAARVGAASVIHGGGGDNVFGSLQSVAPIVDSLRSGGFDRECRRMVREIATLAETSQWTVAWRALQRSRRRSQQYRWTPDLRLLPPGLARHVDAALDHPWLDMPANVQPGRAAHLAVLIPTQGLVEDCDPLAALPSCSILVAQPLLETCLRIPSRYWFEHGNNRAAARRAFAADLPREIAWRRTKGTPDSFVVEIFEAHRPFIRETLLSGLLAANGLIDPVAVRASLDDPRPTTGHAFTRIMQLLDAEVWARHWS